MSAKYNLVCDQATTFNFQFQILNDNTPWSLGGYTGTMTVRPFVGANTTTVVATTENGRMTLDQSNGRVTVTVPVAPVITIRPLAVVATIVVVVDPTNGRTVIVPV